MNKKLLSLCLICLMSVAAMAQRTTDAVGRGLVAVKSGSGVFCSWRINADEYFDVAYNVYRNGTKLNATPLNVSNYYDAAGTTSSTYTIEPVVRGVAQAKCEPVSVWGDHYKELTMDHGSLTSTYIPNDACCADVDGDGEIEIIIKFDNSSDAAAGYLPAGYNGEYVIMEVYKLNGKKLWWIECGPNMTDFQNNENNIAAYDWDMDGKAEALLRAMDGTVIHKADGTTYTVGDPSKNHRPAGGLSGQSFTHHLGAEYLVYLNGATGDVYQCITYPLPTLESGETSIENAWGDGYGHRASKYFFGAPYFDGRKPSIFLARGIYTQHKMVAYDVDPTTHELKLRWRWTSKGKGNSWFGQGYHNYTIGDVDWDGRDEIVFGSMVIDDNGKGLSTSGLGHGDALHLSDFDPYSWGQEFFACNESQPANNFRNATTSEIYYRYKGGSDDGRSMMGNFIDEVPGCEGVSARDGNLISSVTHAGSTLYSKNNAHITQNFRLYWDGDLCEESFNYYNGKNTEGAIYDGTKGLLQRLAGSMTNNDTKGTPSYSGDILGDWREEVIMRTANNNIRIYTTTDKTSWRIPSLWHDHQYRQAMVWQMCGYNQPPHASFFLGKLEGITAAPMPNTMTGRTEIVNGGTISAEHNDKHIILCETNDMNATVANGATPYILTVNAPSWTQGSGNNSNITTTKYTHTLSGSALTGSMRLIKQGEGTLKLHNAVHTYGGETMVWGGKLAFDGTLQSSRLWLNRFTTLESNGGKFVKGIEAEYAASIIPGGENAKGTIEADSLILDFGSRIVFDLFGGDVTADVIKGKVLKLQTCTWGEGPKYMVPVFEFVSNFADGATTLASGKYLIGEFDAIDGLLADVKIEGLPKMKATLLYEDGKLYLEATAYTAGKIVWRGTHSNVWDIDNTANFVVYGTDDERVFVPGDTVYFDDSCTQQNITISGNVSPAAIVFENAVKALSISGDSISGNGTITKNKAGKVTLSGEHHVGNTTLNGGTLIVNLLANNIGQNCGTLGTVDKIITINDGAVFSSTGALTTTQAFRIGEGTATFYITTNNSLTLGTSTRRTGTVGNLKKTGGGSLTIGSSNTISRLIIEGGSVYNSEYNSIAQLPATVEFRGGTLYDTSSFGSYSTNNASFFIDEGETGTFYTDPRCTYKGRLMGAGTFNVYACGSRTYFEGDWSQFEGTIVPGLLKRGTTYDPYFDYKSTTGMGKATLQLNEGFTFNNGGKNIALGAVTGSGTLEGTGTYIIGGSGKDFTFATPCTSKLIKNGTGVMTMTASGKLQSSLTVQAGTLALNQFSLTAKLTGNNAVAATGTATVLGKGYLHSLTIRDNVTLKLHTKASETTPSTIKIANNFISSGNATTTFIISSKTKCSNLDVEGAITPGNIVVEFVNGYTPALGDEFTLWTAASIAADVTAWSLPALGEGLYWDITSLSAATGVLRVTDNPELGINGVESANSTTYAVFNMKGIKVGEVVATDATGADKVKELGVQPDTYLVKSSTTTRKIIVSY